jgi:hypothetical protein
MNNELDVNNKVFIQGEIDSLPEFDHSVKEDDFYKFNLRIPRLSGQADIIPVTIHKRMQQIMKETNDTSHLELLQMDPNESFTLTKMKEIKKQLTYKERSKYHLCRLDYYTIFISSRYFKSIEDFINLELSTKKFNGNMTKFFFTIQYL